MYSPKEASRLTKVIWKENEGKLVFTNVLHSVVVCIFVAVQIYLAMRSPVRTQTTDVWGELTLVLPPNKVV